jgi:hypothetical protein
MQQRLRDARIESLARSVGRMNGNGGRSFWDKLLRRDGLRRGHAGMDFHDRGEDVWRAMRDI